jgi:predicted solute-binding protein
MSESQLAPELVAQGFEIGETALRDAVLESGGFDGLFREFRSDFNGMMKKYALLLEVSTTPEQRERNHKANQEVPQAERVQGIVERLITQYGVPAEDAPSYFMAAYLTKRTGLMEEQ